MKDITPADLRGLLREHALVIGPGEVLVVTVPPDWAPLKIRDLQDALQAVGWDMGLRVLVTPATAAVTVAPMPDVEGVTAGMSDPARYGALALGLCGLLDDGAVLDPAETLGRLHDGTLFGWLGETFRHGLSLSLFTPEDLAVMLARFRELHSAVSTSRVYGIERNGLALLLTFCLGALHDIQSQPGSARDVKPAG